MRENLSSIPKPILVSSGEPAGIGPDLCLSLANAHLDVVVLGDKWLLAQRAKQLGLSVKLLDYDPSHGFNAKDKALRVISIPCASEVVPGLLNPSNAHYVINLLQEAAQRCLSGEFSALVTAPVHKAVINEAGYQFTGHTEFLASCCQVDSVVMMLACDVMKVALVTTHLPLKEVANAITAEVLTSVITQVNSSLQSYFGIAVPKLYVSGLNPHAGESGVLGREELDIILPTIDLLKKQGIDVHGPFPADTLFLKQHNSPCDAFIAMYHDQGLPVLKYCGFGNAVNITLGLPIIRTSVDHGTALDIAAKGVADPGSLFAAIKMAAQMVQLYNHKLINSVPRKD